MFSNASEADKKSIENLFVSVKMNSANAVYIHEDFEKVTTKFLDLKNVFSKYLDYSDKMWANLLSKALYGSDLRTYSEGKASQVGAGYNFQRFWNEIDEHAEILHMAEPALKSAHAAGIRAAAAMKNPPEGGGYRQKKANAVEGSNSEKATSTSNYVPGVSTPAVGKQMLPGQSCLNCKSTDHKVFKCLKPCKLSLCSDPTKEHFACQCTSIFDPSAFFKMKTVNNSIVNSDKVPPNSKPSCSNSLAGRTLTEETIQYD
jgi:hypothetical protein